MEPRRRRRRRWWLHVMTPPAPPHCSTTIISLQKKGKGEKKIIMFEIPRVASASSGPHVMRARKKTFRNFDACVVTFLTPLPFLGGFGAYILFEYFPLFPFGEPCGGPQLPPRKYLGRRDKGEGADIFRLLRWVSAIPLLSSPSVRDELSDIGRRRRRRKERGNNL